MALAVPPSLRGYCFLLLRLRLADFLLERLDLALEGALQLLVGRLLDGLLERDDLRRAERLVGGDFHVGLDAGALPVGLGDGAHGAPRGDEGAEVRAESVAAAGVGAAAGRLADERGALQVLEVVGELLR